MTTSSMVDYYRTGPYRDFAQEHRRGGTYGVSMLTVEQGAIEETDPASVEISFMSTVKPSAAFETNFGDGWRMHDCPKRVIDIQPFNTECSFRLPDMTLRAAFVCGKGFADLLDRHGLTLNSLSGVTEKCRHLPSAIAALDSMWRAANRDDPSASLDLDGSFLTMVGAMIAACGHGLSPAPKIDDSRLNRAVDYAETHIAARLSVGELAAAAAMSPSAFSRAFKATTGETPWHYVRRRRLERAGEMLHRTDASLFEIAVRCGFADASHLARCWKAAHGTTPRGRD